MKHLLIFLFNIRKYFTIIILDLHVSSTQLLDDIIIIIILT
jgi:hypothetical protein